MITVLFRVEVNSDNNWKHGKMKNIILTSIMTILFLTSCIFEDWVTDPDTDDKKDEPQKTVFYENSFETEDDISGWKDINIQMLDEKNSVCEEKSLLIGGGCPQPASTYSLILSETGNYKLSCQAKIDSEYQSAEVAIVKKTVETHETIISLRFTDTDWQQKSGNFFVEAGTEIHIELLVGGIKAVYMNLDCLKIEKI